MGGIIMRIDIMVDIETLGTKSDSTIIQISSVAFNIITGDYIAKFNKIADISKNKDYEMNVTGDTLKWWLNTDKELLTKLLNSGIGSSTELLESFNQYLIGLSSLGELHLWGNGILFDNKMIQHQLDGIGLNYPIKYKNDRDLRTLVDLTCAKLGLTEKQLRERYYDPALAPHDAFNDVINQINLAVNCYKELTKTKGEL
jgi:hypothetical protein